MRNFSKMQELNTGLPIRIQWRTTWWSRAIDNFTGTGHEPFKHCPLHNCQVIPMTETTRDVDAYIFHYNPWGSRDVFNIPRYRSPRQKYIFFTREAESRCNISYEISSLFNLTMSHRLDSDIPQTYGEIRRKLPSDSIPHIGTNFAAGKTELVAWVASNCNSTSRREVYIARLQKYINVDIYGGCGRRVCPKRDCWEHINQNYKFYLAFENSLCKDYITEKVYRTLSLGKMIPIVLGGANYAKLLPRKSHINIADFKTPEDMSRYLKILDANDTLYNEYFDWQNHYEVEIGGTFYEKYDHSYCRLCAYLQLSKSETKIYRDIRQWFSKDRCLKPNQYYGGSMGIL